MRKLPSWLKAFDEYIDNNEAPRTYKIWTGISLLAAALERRVWTQWENKVYPHMFIVLVGGPSVGKGTAMTDGLPLLRSMDDIYVAPDSITPEQFTVRISETTKSFSIENDVHLQSPVYIYANELVNLLNKDYGRFIGKLCDVYDGIDSWTYETRHSGQFCAICPCVNLIGGITPELLQTSVPIEVVGGGFVSRTIFVFGAARSKIIAFPQKTSRQLELQSLLIHDLQRIHELSGEMLLTDGFKKAYEPWYEEARTKPPFKDYHLQYYNGRRPLHLRKLSMIFSASRGDDLKVTREDFTRAKMVLDWTEQGMGDVFESKSKISKPDVMEGIIALLGEEKKVSVETLMQIYLKKVSKEELQSHLTALLVAGVIRQEVGSGGQTWVVWKGMPKNKLVNDIDLEV